MRPRRKKRSFRRGSRKSPEIKFARPLRTVERNRLHNRSGCSGVIAESSLEIHYRIVKERRRREPYSRDRGQWSRAILNSGARESVTDPINRGVIKPGNTVATATFYTLDGAHNATTPHCLCFSLIRSRTFVVDDQN